MTNIEELSRATQGQRSDGSGRQKQIRDACFYVLLCPRLPGHGTAFGLTFIPQPEFKSKTQFWFQILSLILSTLPHRLPSHTERNTAGLHNP